MCKLSVIQNYSWQSSGVFTQKESKPAKHHGRTCEEIQHIRLIRNMQLVQSLSSFFNENRVNSENKQTFVSFDEQSSTAHKTETKYSFVKHYIIYYINFQKVVLSDRCMVWTYDEQITKPQIEKKNHSVTILSGGHCLPNTNFGRYLIVSL